MTRKLTYFCIGAIVSTLSWFVVLFLYANIDSIEIKPRQGGSLQAGFQDVMNAKNLIAIQTRERQNKDLVDVAPTPQITPSRHKFNPQMVESLAKQDNDDDDMLRNNRINKRRQPPVIEAMVASREITETVTSLTVVEGGFDIAADAGIIKTEEEKKLYEKGLSRHAFNEFLSSRLSFHRPIQDVRDAKCSSIKYNRLALPSVSVIICFYNEALSTLLRTIHSVIDRTHTTLIEEILLIDDASDADELKVILQTYCEENFGGIVRITRNQRREGLIRSRMIGAHSANGKVLVFLDSHIEVNEMWLEPLVQRVIDQPQTVVIPIIDMIDADTFEYTASPMVRGGFTWTLHFSWEPIPEDILKSHQDSMYIPTPTMAGGLFAADTDYFFRLGGYDEGMDIWGGENLEMSFRTWMCGGKLEISLCSRVGHIFRDRRPYASPSGLNTLAKNSLRVAHVWLDGYIDKFLSLSKNSIAQMDYGDVGSRKVLRNQLSCNDFSWYLENVYNPDIKRPASSRRKSKKSQSQNIVAKGRLVHSDTGLCLLPHTPNAMSPRQIVVLAECNSAKQKWYQTESDSFMIGKEFCLDVIGGNAIIEKCTNSGGTQKWILDRYGSSTLLYNPGTGRCLGQEGVTQGEVLTIQSCKDAAQVQYAAV